MNDDLWEAVNYIPFVATLPLDVDKSLERVISIYDVSGMIVNIVSTTNIDFPLLFLVIDDETIRPSKIGFKKIKTKKSSSYPRYYASPFIVESMIYDIHETEANGPEGFAYFEIAGDEKTGDLVSTLGGLSGWAYNNISETTYRRTVLTIRSY